MTTTNEGAGAAAAPDYVALLQQAQAVIEKQQQQLLELTALPAKSASVVSIRALGEETLVLLSNGTVVEQKADKPLKVGEVVQVVPMTGQVVRVLPFENYGQSGKVVRVHDDFIQVECEQGLVTATRSRVEVEPGDEVVLDATGSVVLMKVASPPAYAFTGETGVSWDDIGGLEEAKLALQESVELPYVHAGLYKHFGKKAVRGVLLHGLAGNGKTMLGKAVVTAIAKAHGKKVAPGAFVYVKGPELLSKWVGETEQSIRSIFEQGRKHREKHGWPAVIFIDEADALLTARGSRTASGMEHTIVPQFLSEMDGLDETGSIVLLATNRADMLDQAVVRPGRVDRKVYVGQPDEKAVVSIFYIHLRGVPTGDADLAGYAAGKLFSEAFPLYKLKFKGDEGEKVFHMHHAVSGAMVAGLVEQASAKAIHRCIGAKVAKGAIGEQKVCERDVDEAFEKVYGEHLRLSHRLEIDDFCDRQGLKVEAMARHVVRGA